MRFDAEVGIGRHEPAVVATAARRVSSARIDGVEQRQHVVAGDGGDLDLEVAAPGDRDDPSAAASGFAAPMLVTSRTRFA